MPMLTAFGYRSVEVIGECPLDAGAGGEGGRVGEAAGAVTGQHRHRVRDAIRRRQIRMPVGVEVADRNRHRSLAGGEVGRAGEAPCAITPAGCGPEAPVPFGSKKTMRDFLGRGHDLLPPAHVGEADAEVVQR
jgi:hypothetical protein